MNKKIGLTAIAGAMALAACGQGPAPAQNRTLTVNVNGLAEGVQAPITITNTATNTQVSTFNLRGSRAVELPQGNYRVVAGEVANYTATVREANVALTENRTVSFDFTAVPVTPGPGPVDPAPTPRVPARVDFWNGGNPTQIIPAPLPTEGGVTRPERYVVQALRDENGRFLPGRRENNGRIEGGQFVFEKDAYLFASQTEEDVCVTVRVTDAAGNVVNNSRVKIEVTGVERGSVSVQAGCTASASGNVATPLNTDEVLTDANGIARFTLFSTFEAGVRGEPVKVVVRAADQAGQVATPALEFKMLFLNMSHLYYRINGGAPVATTQRSGQSFEINNIFNQETDNSFLLETLTYQKQPRQGPIAPQNLYRGVGSYVSYTVTGTDAGLVRFAYPDGTLIPAGLLANQGRTYGDPDGRGVRIVLTDAARQVLAERPLDVSVNAQFVYAYQYQGNPALYEFALKDYTVNRRLQGVFLNISKSVNNRVLTWAGPGRTLGAIGEITREPYVARVTVRSTNTFNPDLVGGTTTVANTTANNVVLRDVLPPELGYAGNASIRIVNRAGAEVARYAVPPEAVTYDATLHAVTINSIVVGGAAQPINLQAGETAEFSFDVYARQKPGFAWNALPPRTEAGAVPLSATQRRNIVNGVEIAGPVVNDDAQNLANRPYNDPYRVTNGEQAQSVSVSFTAPGQTAPAVVYYSPEGEEADIWVVRPLFEINKALVTPNPVNVGGVAQFNITVTHIDRVAQDRARRAAGQLNPVGVTPLAQVVGYDTLAARFPFEFGGRDFDSTLPAGPGPLPGEVVRNNPYINGATIEDRFADSLDFVRGTPFFRNTTVASPAIRTGTRVALSGLPTPNTTVVGKSVNWALLAQGGGNVVDGTTGQSVAIVGTEEGLQRGQSATAQLFLTTNVAGAATNCALLSANQLNQPAVDAAGRTVDLSRGPQTSYTPNVPWRQSELTAAQAAGNPLVRANTLASCVIVNAVARPIFRLALSNHAEFINGNPVLNEAERRDIYSVGENFFLKYTIDNSEVGAATGVTFTVTRQDDRAVWIPGGIVAYTFNTTTGVWDPIASVAAGNVTVIGNTVTFNNITIPGRDPNIANSRGEVRFVLQSNATRVGTSEVVAEAVVRSATNPSETVTLGPVREETTIIR